MKQFSVLSTQSIRRHPTNNSSSKNAINFSKQERFLQNKSNCAQAFYTKPDTLSSRKAGIGYGEKYDFTKTGISFHDKNKTIMYPGSGQYQVQSDFDLLKSKKNGKSFGNARQQISNKSYFIPQLKRVPGPGQYSINNANDFICGSNGNSKICYSTRPKTLDVIQKHLSFKQAPGPGTYQTLNLNSNSGKQKVSSKYKDIQFSKIDPSSPRFALPNKSTLTPGPLTYKQVDCIDPIGKYHVSKFKAPKRTIFSLSKRSFFTDQQSKRNVSPGPGGYDSPSQFGKYGDAKYYKTLKNFYNNPQK